MASIGNKLSNTSNFPWRAQEKKTNARTGAVFISNELCVLYMLRKCEEIVFED